VAVPELVIFDCDGVLVDSEVISAHVLAAMLTAEGLAMDAKQARAEFQGLLLADVGTRAEARLGRRLPDDWLARFERDRAAVFQRELRPVAGAAQAVGQVKRAGVAVCVASQGKLSKTDLSLSLTGLDRLFPPPVRFSAYAVANGKPAPDLFLHAAETMGAEASECVVVEDTASGIAAARSAGMRPLGYAADADEGSLVQAGAELFHSFRELPGLVGVS
jgi:HAD superfamily hydrolase (TIGR01509 family)